MPIDEIRYGIAMQVLGAVAVAGALLLTAAGIGHLRHRSRLRAALAAQRLFPRRLHAPIATLVPLLELAVGGSVLASQLAPTLSPPMRAAPLLAQVALFAVFSGYLSVLRRHRPAAPCGCFGADGPVSWLAVARAAVLAAGTAGTALATARGSDALAAAPPMILLATLAAGVLLAMAGWLVPALLATSAPGPVTPANRLGREPAAGHRRPNPPTR